MQKSLIGLEEIKLVGICVRTSYTLEQEEETKQILDCMRRFFYDELYNLIPDRKTPGIFYCAYTAYETDQKGAFNFFIGEEVTKLPDNALSNRMLPLVIPPQTYAKFTTPPGPLEHTADIAWDKIHNMTPAELGGKRHFVVDFERFDDKSNDPEKSVLDIYIGLAPHTTNRD